MTNKLRTLMSIVVGMSGYRARSMTFMVEDNVVCLPLYLYDHGGITMNTTGFACSWIVDKLAGFT